MIAERKAAMSDAAYFIYGNRHEIDVWFERDADDRLQFLWRFLPADDVGRDLSPAEIDALLGRLRALPLGVITLVDGLSVVRLEAPVAALPK